jgi:hypothetical protein
MVLVRVVVSSPKARGQLCSGLDSPYYLREFLQGAPAIIFLDVFNVAVLKSLLHIYS